jgi:polyribonucleotide nucleotidyltransferase
VQVEADKLIGAAQHTMDKIYERTGHKCFMEREDGWYKVYCGSFESEENAEKRKAEIIEAFRFSMLYQGAFVKSVKV